MASPDSHERSMQTKPNITKSEYGQSIAVCGAPQQMAQQKHDPRFGLNPEPCIKAQGHRIAAHSTKEASTFASSTAQGFGIGIWFSRLGSGLQVASFAI